MSVFSLEGANSSHIIALNVQLKETLDNHSIKVYKRVLRVREERMDYQMKKVCV